MKAIHHIGLKHNDIKPQNIIVCNKTVKLIDFGLSTIKKQTIKYRGTAGYIPLNKSVVVCCRRQDVYGVIATMFFYLFGTCPFSDRHTYNQYLRNPKQYWEKYKTKKKY